MKKFKAIIILLITASVLMTSCSKHAIEQQTKTEKTQVAKVTKTVMFASELNESMRIKLPGIDYTNGSDASMKGKPKANAVLVNVWQNDLTLIPVTGGFITTISPNAEWGGVQNFSVVDATNSGYSECNWNWSNQTPPPNMPCNTTASGNHRSWTSDKPFIDSNGDTVYTVHVSGFVAN